MCLLYEHPTSSIVKVILNVGFAKFVWNYLWWKKCLHICSREFCVEIPVYETVYHVSHDPRHDMRCENHSDLDYSKTPELLDYREGKSYDTDGGRAAGA